MDEFGRYLTPHLVDFYDKLDKYVIHGAHLGTLQGTNISHLGKRKIIFKIPFLGDMLIPWRVILLMVQKKTGRPPAILAGKLPNYLPPTELLVRRM